MWRDTQRRISILGVDAWAIAPVFIWCVHWRWWTAYLAVAGVVFFVVLERFGLSIPGCARRVRCWIVGKDRSGVPVWKRRFYA